MLEDRARLARILVATGVVGLIASLTVGILGWMLAGRLTTAASELVDPMGRIAIDVANALDAGVVLVQQTTEAITGIEDAARSTGRALESATDAMDQASELLVGDIADSLQATVDTLPGLIDTASVIDTTMRALSLFGVDYDPDEPLDEALIDLQLSLTPIPGQIRGQAEVLGTLQTDIGRIGGDAGSLAAVLLETRISMSAVESIVDAAAADAAAAASAVESIRVEFDMIDTTILTMSLAAAIALAAAAAGPLLVGLHLIRVAGSGA